MMRALLQRVESASVSVDGRETGRIAAGILLLVGVSVEDEEADIEWLCKKISQLRIFNDEQGVMNRSVMEAGGEVLAVSQFTLYASVRKGNRPSYSRAAPSSLSLPLFERFVARLSTVLGRPVPTGEFGADMRVSLVNDGPVTIWIDSRQVE